MTAAGTAPGLVASAELRWQDTERTLRRLRGARRRASERLFWTYVALLFGVPLGLAFVSTVRDVGPLTSAEAALLLARLSVAVPAVLLAVAALGLRVAAWHGVVVVSRPDVAWLLTAPVPRERVLGPRLARSLSSLALAGGLVVLVAAGGLALSVGTTAPGLAVAAMLGACGGAAAGALVGAAGWLVQCRPAWAARVLRAAPAVAAASAAVALAAGYGLLPPAAAAVSAWPGPWWGPAAGAALVLTALAAVTVPAARRQLRTVPLEELRRREATATRLRAAAAYAADLRGGAQARREAVAELVGRRPRSRRGPARAWLAEPWSSALLLLRSRERIAHAVAWVGAAVAIALTIRETSPRGAVVALAVAAYPAASALAEPLRVELEQRFSSRAGLWPTARILRRQAAVPAALLAVLGGLAATAVGLVGLLSPGHALAWLVLAPAVAVLLTACAAVVATGPGPDPGLLHTGDTGVVLLLAHLTQGAHLAAAVVGVPGVAATAALVRGVPATVVVLAALAWSVAAAAVLDGWARRRLGRFD